MSRPLIATSIVDPVGRAVKNIMLEYASCRETSVSGSIEAYVCSYESIEFIFTVFEPDVIYLEQLSNVEAPFAVVVSRHESQSKMPSLTVHTPGNLGPFNAAGGKPWEAPPSNPRLQHLLLLNLARLAREEGLEGFDITYEATHHGPTSVAIPVTFVEIGSSEKEWGNVYAQRVLTLALLRSLNDLDKHVCIASVGFGGPHYAKPFTERSLHGDECYGHIVARYVLNQLGQEVSRAAEMAITLTPNVKRVVVEKMRSEIRSRIEEVARRYGLEVVRL